MTGVLGRVGPMASEARRGVDPEGSMRACMRASRGHTVLVCVAVLRTQRPWPLLFACPSTAPSPPVWT